MRFSRFRNVKPRLHLWVNWCGFVLRVGDHGFDFNFIGTDAKKAKT